MFIVVGNGISNPSSIPGRGSLYSVRSNTFGNSQIYLIILQQWVTKIKPAALRSKSWLLLHPARADGVK